MVVVHSGAQSECFQNGSSKLILSFPYGLYINEHNIEDPGSYVSILRYTVCFDFDGNLQTDLYVKETDARSYLYLVAHMPTMSFLVSFIPSVCA